MKFYFWLQYQRFLRKLHEWGVHPFVGIVLMVLAFGALSTFLFYKITYAIWIYSALLISLWLTNSEKSRNEQLKLMFTQRIYTKIRLIENALVGIPFIIFMIFKQEFLAVILLIPIFVLMSIFTVGSPTSVVIPTPFKRFPFEFVVGFRKNFWLILIALFLLFKSVSVHNFNLGIFSFAIIYLFGMSCYLQPEREVFVWMFSRSPKAFLLHKLETVMMCISMLAIPFAALLMLFYFENVFIILGAFLIGYIFLAAVVLAKYAAFPNEMNIPQGILFSMSITFPPMILVTIYLFYTKAIQKLHNYLA